MKILVALSGGVDSSITAKKLQDAGHEVVGAYMKLHKNEAYHEKNIAKVRKVGEFLGIKTHILDLQGEFEKSVFMPFIEAYKNGKTPNPCALCNRHINLGKLLEFARLQGCEKLATGHYARLENGLIKVALDLSKDQSYFLANVDPDALKSMIFPLGESLKSDIKNEARNYPQLSEIAGAKESSEICFVENSYIDILKDFMQTDLPGRVLNSNGEIIGTHSGYMHYTIGKRRGFRIDGAHDPHFVLGIDPQKNEIIVGKKEELESYEFSTINFNNFLSVDEILKTDEIFVKIRYRSPKIRANLQISGSCENGVKVYLNEPANGIASGQLAVFYDKFDRVIASGFIA